MAGYLKQVQPKSSAMVTFQYDPESCVPTGGVGGWQEVPRPLQVNGTEFNSTPLYNLTLTMVLDGLREGRSVEPTIAQYRAWGQGARNGETPPVLMLHYGVYDKLRWVMQDVKVTNDLRRDDGQIVQCTVELTLLEYQGLTASRTAADSVRTGIVTSTPAMAKTSYYTVVKGDTLQKIAARKLGNANRWTEISKLNKVKDPIHLKVGSKLRLPTK